MPASITADFGNYGWKGTALAGQFTATGFDADPNWQVTGLPAGLSTDTTANVLTIQGAPTESGIFEVKVTALGAVSGIATAVTGYDDVFLVEGDGLLAGYHLDPTEIRDAVDIQYNLFARTWRSGVFDVSAGIDLFLGETTRVHALIARRAVRTVADGLLNLPDPPPDPVSLVIRPLDQRDGPELLRMSAATGAEDINTTGVEAAYFDISVGGRVLDQIFRALNLATGADAASASIRGALELSFTLDGRAHVTTPLLVNLRQSYTR